MARLIYKTNLEAYVEAYLSQHNRSHLKTGDINLLRKAIVYIQEMLNGKCCSDEPVINLYTGNNSMFTRTIYTLLLQTPLYGNRQSLQRTVKLIQDYIFNPCCFQNLVANVLGPTIGVSNGLGVFNTTLSSSIEADEYLLDSIISVEYYIDNVLRASSVTQPNYDVPVIFTLNNSATPQNFTYYAVFNFPGGNTVTTNTQTIQVLPVDES